MPAPLRDANGRWLPGSSGNGGGRPPLPAEIKERAANYSPRLVDEWNIIALVSPSNLERPAWPRPLL